MYTKREKEIIKLLLQGKSSRSIAESLFISEHTVNKHVEHIFAKSNTHSRSQLILKLLQPNAVPQI